MPPDRREASLHKTAVRFPMSSIIPFVARLAEQAPTLAADTQTPCGTALELFRSCTRRHVTAGLKLVRQSRGELERLEGGAGSERIWKSLHSDCRAMFLTEMLGRLWSGILEARSRRVGSDPLLKNVARYALLQHLELRREILNLMNRWCSEAYPQVADLDFQYRRMERWTDVLLGPLVKQYGLHDYVFDPSRAMEYSLVEDLPGKTSRGSVGRLPRNQAINGFLASYRGFLAEHRLLREHQSGMIRSILGMLPDDSLFSEQRYLLGRIWAESELNRSPTTRRINIAPA